MSATDESKRESTSGTLLLSLETVADAPKFFAILSLVERTAGRRIVVVDEDSSRKRGEGERLATMAFGVCLHEYLQRPKFPPRDAQMWKLEQAKRLPPPVIWVDLDFGRWRGPKLEATSELVTLDWSRARTIGNPQKAAEV